MSCDNISNLCADPTFSTCVDYEGDLGANTKITSKCVNQSDVNTDLYAITDEIISNQSTTNLAALCLTYPLVDGVITLSTVNEVHEQEICTLKQEVQTLKDFDYSTLDITGFNLNFDCLVDPCGAPISTLGQLLQIIINKSCV